MAKFTTIQDEILIEEVQKYPAIYDYENENYKNFLVKENGWKKISLSVKKDVDECKKRWKSMKDTFFRHKRKPGTGTATRDKPVKWNLYQRLLFLDKVKHERSSKQTLDFGESQMSDNEFESEPVEDISQSTLGDNDYMDSHDESVAPSTSSTSKAADKSPNTSVTSGSRCSSAASTTPTNKRVCRNDMNRDAFLRGIHERAEKRTEILASLAERQRGSHGITEPDEIDLFMKSISLTVKKLPQPLINEAKLGILTLVNDLQEKANDNSLRGYFMSYTLPSQQPLTPVSNSEFPAEAPRSEIIIDDITVEEL